MNKLHFFLGKFSINYFSLIGAYCRWAEDQAMNKKDLLVLGLGPSLILGLVLLSLPTWLSKTVALILLLPFLYLAYIIIMAYCDWDNRK